jgi:hypothetical protein
MDSVFQFQYERMAAFYSDEKDNNFLFEVPDDMQFTLITRSDKYERTTYRIVRKRKLTPLPNKDSQGHRTPFIKRHIVAQDIRKIKFINNPPYFPLGLYVIKQDPTNIFFVFPTFKQVPTGTFVSADHLSFPYDKSDPKHQIHLHMTHYIPPPLDPNIGYIHHTPSCYFADNITLPLRNYDTPVFASMGAIAGDVLDICRAYASNTGGSGRRTQHIINEPKPKRRRSISKKLTEILEAQNVTKLYSIAFRHDQVWNITTVVERLGGANAMYDDFKFTLNSYSYSEYQKKLYRALVSARPMASS